MCPNGCVVVQLWVRAPGCWPGNEAVLRARFEDAQFFYRADLGTPMEAMRARLAGTLFHKDLGSLLAKAERVERLVAPLAAASGLAGAHHSRCISERQEPCTASSHQGAQGWPRGAICGCVGPGCMT